MRHLVFCLAVVVSLSCLAGADLRSSLAAMKPDDAVTAVLRQAGDAKSPEAKVQAVKLLDELRGKGLLGKLSVPVRYAGPWWWLLDDRRLYAETGFQVADYYLDLNERLYAPPTISVCGASSSAMELILKYQDVGRAFLRKRVSARFSGVAEKDLPPWPDVSGAAGKLRQRLVALDSREAAVRMADGLTAREIELLPFVLADDPALNAKLSAYANTVTAVDCGDDSFRRELLAWMGKPVTVELVGRLQDYGKSQAMAVRDVDCLIKRQDKFGGCAISVKAHRCKGVVGYAGQAFAEGVYGAARWRFGSEPEKLEGDTCLTSSRENQVGFTAAVEAFCGGEVPANSPGVVRFMSKLEERR